MMLEVDILTYKRGRGKIRWSLKGSRWSGRKSVTREESPGSIESGSR